MLFVIYLQSTVVESQACYVGRFCRFVVGQTMVSTGLTQLTPGFHSQFTVICRQKEVRNKLSTSSGRWIRQKEAELDRPYTMHG